MAFDFIGISDNIADKQAKIDLIEAAAAAKTKDLKDEVKALENTLLLAMLDSGLTTIKGKHSIADVKESLRISFKDFDAFAKFAKRKDALHMFERRISITAYREMKESLGNKEIPGLAEFNQQKLNVRKTKD